MSDRDDAPMDALFQQIRASKAAEATTLPTEDAPHIQARQRRIARHKARAAQTPSRVDDAPQGHGPTNRHGMPAVPIGQRVVRKWPILDLGVTPKVDAQSWRLRVDGAVEQAIELDMSSLRALPQVEDISDFHCVTTWSKLDMRWRGVQVSTVLALAGLTAEATHLMCHGYDGYTTNVSIEEAVKDDVLLVHTWEDAPLPFEHGGPVRMITPQLYAWKGSKWISRIEVITADRPGFWEERGYSMTGYPWRDDRYS